MNKDLEKTMERIEKELIPSIAHKMESIKYSAILLKKTKGPNKRVAN